MATKKASIPVNPDGLWRRYHGVRTYHRYVQGQLRNSYQHQVALCGRETRVGNCAFSRLGAVAYGLVCRKCESILEVGLP